LSRIFASLEQNRRLSWVKKRPFNVQEHALLACKTCPS
jgi:hypothetical protein